jgi:hypothetical protein
MEKLIELLNEYEKEELKSEFYEWEKWIWWDTNLFRRDTRDEEWSHIYSDTADTYVISKKYGFIWWLVENDKIDLVKVYENLTNYEIEIRIRAVKELLENNEEDTIAYLKLLMLLAIQDEPIRFLCEILK